MSRAHNRRLGHWLGYCLALGLTLAACGPPRSVQRMGWTGDAAPVSLDRLLHTDADHLQQLTDLTAEVHFLLHKVGSASGSILYQPPALLRLDVRGPLFQRILSAVLDGDRLLALADGRLYEMPASNGLDAFIDIDLVGYDPRLALLGVLAPTGVIEAIDYPRVDRAWITLNDGIQGQRRRLLVDLHKGFVEREDLIDDQGQTRWSRKMSGWRRMGDTELYLPTKIRIESRGHVLELEYGDVYINKGLARATFFSGIGTP